MKTATLRTTKLARLLAATAALGAGAPAGALQIADGDLVGVFVKNGFELVVNLGPVDPGSRLDLSGTVGIPEFGGSLADAKFVALAVEDPGRTVTCCGGTFPLENIVYTTLQPDPMPDDNQIASAMGKVDQPDPGAVVWFNLLRQLSGTDTELISSSELYSYESVLGVGADAVGSAFPFSTAGFFDGSEMLQIPLYSAVRGYADFGGPDPEHLELVTLAFDGGMLEFAPAPEAPAVLRLLAGISVLLAARRIRRSFAA